MCLILKAKEPEVLTEDLKIYKLLYYGGRQRAVAPFQSFSYEFEKQYETEITFETEGDSFQFFDGREAIIQEIGRERAENQIRTGEVLRIAGGFHGAVTKKRFTYLNGREIFECTYPKGSTVYREDSGLIVSNKIIVHKK